MRPAQVVIGIAFCIIGLRFALAAGGVIDVDRFDYGFVALLAFGFAHTCFTADIERVEEDD